MNTAKQTQFATVHFFPTRLTKEDSFRIFLSNLYIKLDYSDLAFTELLSNPASNFSYLENNRTGVKVLIDAKFIEQRIKRDFANLGFAATAKIYREFLKKNNIQPKQKVA